MGVVGLGLAHIGNPVQCIHVYMNGYKKEWASIYGASNSTLHLET